MRQCITIFLVDMPLLRGIDWLEPSTPLYVSDLEEWEDFAGVTVGSGDVLLVRTGRWAKREQDGPWDYAGGGAGLHASVLPWLTERGVAMLVGDAVNDVQPSGVEGLRSQRAEVASVMRSNGGRIEGLLAALRARAAAD